MELNKEQIEFLNKYTRGTWTFNEETGLVDIEGDFYCSDKSLTDFKGVKFGVVSNDFDCQNNKLKSLKGAPQEVGRYFSCHNNKLTSLEGAPEVGWHFCCSDNKLTSLEGAPQEVRGYFDCSNNKLTSLVGAPQKVGWHFDCSNNKLTSLVGAPQEVGENFSCYDNNMMPIPEKILKIVIKTMLEKRVNYYVALSLNNEAIEEELNKRKKHLEEIERVFVEIDANVSKDTQKTYSIISRYR